MFFCLFLFFDLFFLCCSCSDDEVCGLEDSFIIKLKDHSYKFICDLDSLLFSVVLISFSLVLHFKHIFGPNYTGFMLLEYVFTKDTLSVFLLKNVV